MHGQCLERQFAPAGTVLDATGRHGTWRRPTRTPCGRHAHPAGRLTAADTDPVPVWFFFYPKNFMLQRWPVLTVPIRIPTVSRRQTCHADQSTIQTWFFELMDVKNTAHTCFLNIYIYIYVIYIITNLMKHTCPTNWLIWEALQVLHPLVTATQAREAARGICGSQASAPFDLLSALDQSSRTIKKLGL